MTIDIAGEGFCASGLVVTARNFLDVYPYQVGGGRGIQESSVAMRCHAQRRGRQVASLTASPYLSLLCRQKWGTPHETLPHYVEGQTFEPASIDLKPVSAMDPRRVIAGDFRPQSAAAVSSQRCRHTQRPDRPR